jgi:hypothetical protein
MIPYLQTFLFWFDIIYNFFNEILNIVFQINLIKY